MGDWLAYADWERAMFGFGGYYSVAKGVGTKVL
jgi:hypothetical protein